LLLAYVGILFPITARLIPFLLVAVTLVVAPGPDFAMVTRNVLRGGRSAGLFTAMGVATGIAVWTLASVAGIAELLQVSATAFTVVKLAGAAYLLYLGAKMVLSAVRKRDDRSVGNGGDRAAGPAASRGVTAYRQGLTCNLLNPKAAAIFTSVVPQFITPGSFAPVQLGELGLIFVVLVWLWLSIYSVIAGLLADVLKQRKVRRVIDGITGCVLIAFGLRLAAEG
jgi:threonine/homoserine/homoserine lactone efflux protein